MSPDLLPQFEYAAYVWSSYGLFAVILLWQFAAPWIRRRQLLDEVREEIESEIGDPSDANP